MAAKKKRPKVDASEHSIADVECHGCNMSSHDAELDNNGRLLLPEDWKWGLSGCNWGGGYFWVPLCVECLDAGEGESYAAIKEAD